MVTMGVRVMIPTISPVSDISVMPLCVLSWCSSPMVPPFARGLVSGEIWDRMFDSGCNPCAAVRSIVLSPHLLRSEDQDSVVC